MSFPGGITVLVASTGEFGAAEPGTVFAAGASKLVLAPSRPVAIMRWGALITTAVVNTATVFAMTLDFHPTVGSASGNVAGATTQLQGQTGWNASALPAFYTDLAGGSITTAANATLAAGKGVYHQINPQTKMPPTDSSTNPVPSPDTAFVPGGGEQSLGLTIYPGQEASITIATVGGSAAGAGILFIHYIPLAFQGASSNYENVASGIPSSIQPVVGDPGIWTRLLT